MTKQQHVETVQDPPHTYFVVITKSLQGGGWTIKPLISLILFKYSACVVKLSEELWNVITSSSSSQGCVGVSINSSKIKLVIEFLPLIRLLSYHEWSSELLRRVKLSDMKHPNGILSRCYIFAALRLKTNLKRWTRGNSRHLVLSGKAISRMLEFQKNWWSWEKLFDERKVWQQALGNCLHTIIHQRNQSIFSRPSPCQPESWNFSPDQQWPSMMVNYHSCKHKFRCQQWRPFRFMIRRYAPRRPFKYLIFVPGLIKIVIKFLSPESF